MIMICCLFSYWLVCVGLWVALSLWCCLCFIWFCTYSLCLFWCVCFAFCFECCYFGIGLYFRLGVCCLLDFVVCLTLVCLVVWVDVWFAALGVLWSLHWIYFWFCLVCFYVVGCCTLLWLFRCCCIVDCLYCFICWLRDELV